MKRFCFILLFAMLVSVLARAQENKPVTQMGTTSFNFTFNGFDGFGAGGSYVGSVPPGNTLGDSLLNQLNLLLGQRFIRPIYGFGVTFYVADNVGLRIGFGANMASNNTPRAGDTTGAEDTETNLALGFSPALQIHIVNSGPVTLYTGVIFSVASAFAWQGADDSRTVDTQMGYGGGAILGTEFYPTSNLSLGLETQIGVDVTTTSRKVKNKSTDGPGTTNIGFTLPIRVNVSFHI
jgi:hypothetical protein